MLLLERKMPLELLFYQAMLRRLPLFDSQISWFEEQLGKVQAGYAGEVKTDFEWGRFRLPSEYFLLHDFQVTDLRFYSHQMDTVFLCPNFAVVLEIKNIIGKLYFDKDTSQFWRLRDDGKQESFYNPIDQVERHAFCLKDLLKHYGSPLPVIHLVVLVNPSAILMNIEKGMPIVHLSGLQRKLLELYQRFDKPLMESKELKKVALKLKKLHEPKLKNIRFDRSKILRGVLCENCTEQQVMAYYQGNFECTNCKIIDNTAFIKAISDYRLLIGEHITNKQFRAFFGIHSSSVVSNMLAVFGWKFTGTFRNRIYCIPLEVVSNHLELNWRRRVNYNK